MESPTLPPARGTRRARRQRRTEPGRLVSRLKGDLDWIAMNALEKDRTRRYGSPGEMAADIERHLHDQPVAAGPPSVAYRARKFVRRHRFGAAAAAVALIGLLAFAATMAAQATRIAHERDRASAEKVDREILDIRRRVSGPANPDTVETMNNLADDVLRQGRYDEAEELRLQVLETYRRKFGASHIRVAGALYNLACVSARRGRRAEALDRLRQAIEGGYKDPDLAGDADMQSLRTDPEFQRLAAAAQPHGKP